VKLGDTEEWTILNKDSQYHDFHIHQTGFLVTQVNGAPTDFDGLRDTFSVPPSRNGETGRGETHHSFHKSSNCGSLRVSLPRRETRRQGHDDDSRRATLESSNRNDRINANPLAFRIGYGWRVLRKCRLLIADGDGVNNC
jgi:hypothetical protein